ncbi:MAPEG family protein [Roseobacter litoralis]|uniref:MAPEG family protein n=1 Tax=Roseobacter litoralis TaxID=42443 RepID=UPI00248F74F6|nr:MAPEG family protein [Roseobacter litoralis]
MTPELTVLALAALLQVAQMGAYSVAGNMQIDAKTAFGPRDTPVHLTGVAARLQRAMNNHFEGLILFSIAVGVVSISGQSTGFTAACAWVYLAARIAYVPAYAFGLSPWRSIIWMIGVAATTALLIAGLI